MADARTERCWEGRSYATADDRIAEAVFAWADADSDDDVAYHRAKMRHRKALISAGWTPPGPKQHRRPSMLTNQLPLWRHAKPVPSPGPK
jgi:hypothetical protein